MWHDHRTSKGCDSVEWGPFQGADAVGCPYGQASWSPFSEQTDSDAFPDCDWMSFQSASLPAADEVGMPYIDPCCNGEKFDASGTWEILQHELLPHRTLWAEASAFHPSLRGNNEDHQWSPPFVSDNAGQQSVPASPMVVDPLDSLIDEFAIAAALRSPEPDLSKVEDFGFPNTVQSDKGNKEASVDQIAYHGDLSGGPVFALRDGFQPDGQRLQASIFCESAHMFQYTRKCTLANLKKFPSTLDAESWIRAGRGGVQD